MSLSWPSWFTFGNTILAYPQPIVPIAPDFMNCDARYAQGLKPLDCKFAVAAMPAAREGADAEWAVNHRSAQYSLPMTIHNTRDRKGMSLPSFATCAVSIEAAGPHAHYDLAAPLNRPFTLKASPFQLRGLAAYVLRSCVNDKPDQWGRRREGTGGRGGFATHKIQNLADYISQTNDLRTYPWNSTFFTVTIHRKDKDPPEAGNYDPSVAVLVADFLKNRQRGSGHDLWRKLNNAINDFTKRTQNMYAGGKTTPWWGATAGMVDKMSYECDAKLGAPAEVDCAQLEWSQLGPDEDDIDLGSSLTKVLSSNTCQLVITAAVATVVNWRQVRVALDTLLNVCLASPIQRATGGRAYVGPHPGISGGIWGRQLDNSTLNPSSGDVTGLNALPAGINITLSSTPTG